VHVGWSGLPAQRFSGVVIDSCRAHPEQERSPYSSCVVSLIVALSLIRARGG